MNEEMKTTVHKLVLEMMNNAIIELKLLEDIISDKDDFIKLYESADTSELTSFQGFMVGRIIMEANEVLIQLLTKLKNGGKDEEATQDKDS